MKGIDLNKEAEEQYPLEGEDSIYCDMGLIQQSAFIAGANSKHVQAKILQAQIEVIDKMSKDMNAINYGYMLANNRFELQQQLKQLENGSND